MFKHIDNPKYHIVSVRVSEVERENLHMMSRQSQKTISDLMREALQIWIASIARRRSRNSWRTVK